MSSTADEKDEPADLAALADKLLEQTKQGKLKWQPTASADAFLITVEGQTFKVCLEQSVDIDLYGSPEHVDLPAVILMDDKGKAIWTIRHSDVPRGLWPLYRWAKRVGNDVDERVAAALKALGRL